MLIYISKITSVALCVSLLVQEQTSMAKLGLELRLLSSDVDSEVEKWEEQEHDIVRQSQSLASMAYNMYLFTRYGTVLLYSIYSHQHIYWDYYKICIRIPKRQCFRKTPSLLQFFRVLCPFLCVMYPVMKQKDTSNVLQHKHIKSDARTLKTSQDFTFDKLCVSKHPK